MPINFKLFDLLVFQKLFVFKFTDDSIFTTDLISFSFQSFFLQIRYVGVMISVI